MTDSYLLGNKVRLSGQFQDATTKAFVSPTTVVLKITSQAGTVETVTPTLDSVGKYHYDYVPVEEGLYTYQFNGTGSVIAAGKSNFLMYS